MLIPVSDPSGILFVSPTQIWVAGKEFKTIEAALRWNCDEHEPLLKMLEELDHG